MWEQSGVLCRLSGEGGGDSPLQGPWGLGQRLGKGGGRRESQLFKSPAETGGNVQFLLPSKDRVTGSVPR